MSAGADMLTYETLHHVAVAVTDLVRAKRFYGGVLGLKEISRPAFSFERRRVVCRTAC